MRKAVLELTLKVADVQLLVIFVGLLKDGDSMIWGKKLAIVVILLTLLIVPDRAVRSQETVEARPGDLIIRFEGNTLGPMGGIPHIGIYVGESTSGDGTRYDVVDLTSQKDRGIIGPSASTDTVAFKDPGFFSLLDGAIAVQYKGDVTRLSALPEATRNRIRERACELAKKDLGRDFGKYEFMQFPTGHSRNCGDWVLDLYNRALLSEGVQVMSNKYPYSDVFAGAKGLRPGELRDYAEILWGTTDPSRLPGWLPQVGSPHSSMGIGGVHVDPEPVSVGKGGGEEKTWVLESRPSQDSLTWPVSKTGKGE